MKKLLLLPLVVALVLTTGAAHAQNGCDSMPLPYTENFNVQNGLPQCWTAVGSEAVYGLSYPTCNYDACALEFLSLNGEWHQVVATAPLPTTVHAVEVSFEAWLVADDARLEVGLLPPSNNAADFYTLQSIVQSDTVSVATALEQHRGWRIALRFHGASGSPQHEALARVSSFAVRALSSCVTASIPVLQHIDSTEATIVWNSTNNSSQWLLRFNADAAVPTDTNYAHFANLEPNTNYHVELRSLCVAGDTSEITVLDFRTLCGLHSLPYAADFEQEHVTDQPQCWQGQCEIETEGNNQYLSFTTAYAPAIYTAGAAMQVDYDLYATQGGTLEAGVAVVRNGDTTYHKLQEVTLLAYDYATDHNWHHYSFYTDTLGTLSADEPLVAYFRHTGYGSMRIDNVQITESSECHNPIATRIDTAYGNSVELSWSDYSVAQEGYQVLIHNQRSTTEPDALFYTEHPYATIDYLRPMCVYDFSVRSVCAGADAEWIYIGAVATSCGDIETPYYEDFALYANHDTLSCWIDTAHQWSVVANQLALPSTTGTATIVSPTIATPADELYISFDYTKYTPLGATLTVGFVHEYGDSMTVVYQTTADEATTAHVGFYTDDIEFEGTGRLCFSVESSAMWIADAVACGIDNLHIYHATSCHHPMAVAIDNVGHDQAMVHVADTLGIGQYVIYLHHDDTTELVSLFDSVGIVIGLNPGTEYTAQVTALCPNGEESLALASTGFATLCTPITHQELPFAESFDTYIAQQPSANMPCWNFIDYGLAASQQHQPIANHGGNGVLYLASATNSNQYYAVLPEVDYTTDLYLGLDMQLLDVGATLEVGIMLYPNEVVTFTPIDTLTDNVLHRWRHFDLPLEGYTGGGKFVALRVTNASVLVDNVVLDKIPDCSQRIDSLQVSNVWSFCADVSWAPSLGHNTDAYYMINVADQNNQPSGLFYTTSTEYTVCNLDEMQVYSLWVEMHCGGDVQAVSDTITFATRCDNMQSVEATHQTHGTAMLASQNLPLNPSMVHSASQQMLSADEFDNLPSNITGLDLQFAGHDAECDIDNCQIYISHTTLATLDQWQPHGTLVYDGPLHLHYGWNTIYFTQTIHHPASQNVVLTIVARNSNTAANANFATYAYAAGQARFYASATEAITDSIAQFADRTTAVNYRANMRLHICPQEVPQCIMPRITSLAANEHSITVNYNTTSACEVQLTTNSYWTADTTGIATEGGHYTFTNLQPHVRYIVGVRRPCADGYSPWHVDHIVTEIPSCTKPQPPVITAVDNTSATIGIVHSNANRYQVHVFNYLIDTIITTATASTRVEGLVPSVTYSVSLRALCDYNNRSPWSDTTTFATTYCHPVATAQVQPTGSASVNVWWTLDDAPHVPQPSTYRVMYGLHGFGHGDELAVLETPEQSLEISGLDFEHNSYDFFVSTHCTDGSASVWTSAGTYPPAPAEGIARTSAEPTLALQPNPATTAVVVTCDADATVVLIDLNGRTLATNSSHQTTRPFDLTHLPAGTYFVRAISSHGTAVRKLVLR